MTLALAAIATLLFAITITRDLVLGFRTRREAVREHAAAAVRMRMPYRDLSDVETEAVTYRELRYKQALESIAEAIGDSAVVSGEMIRGIVKVALKE